jgi:hypothetical protein
MNKKVNGYTPVFTGHTKSHICINNFYLYKSSLNHIAISGRMVVIYAWSKNL